MAGKGKSSKRGRSVPKFLEKPASPLVAVASPPSVGAITAAVLAFSPGVLPQLPASETGLGRALAAVPDRLYAAVVGFALGYGATRTLQWLRRQTLTALLSYKGWIYNARSRKTKVSEKKISRKSGMRLDLDILIPRDGSGRPIGVLSNQYPADRGVLFIVVLFIGSFPFLWGFEAPCMHAVA